MPSARENTIGYTGILADFYRMLIVRHLYKNYSGLTVVNDVSLTVAKGEVVSVTGPSGAGKSTLLHLLGGLDKPDAGTVMIQDTDMFRLAASKQAAFRNLHIGFVFQFHHLLPEFTALENVAIPLWIAGKRKKEATMRAMEMLERVGLQHRATHQPAALSGGEQQRVAIARALVNQPSVVMADEPTGNLDSNNARSVHELFLSLRNEMQQTFVMITHNEMLAAMTDRTLVMKDGKITEEKKNVIN